MPWPVPGYSLLRCVGRGIRAENIGVRVFGAKENVNNIDTVHLHYGLELIFDEEWRENGHEIWVDCYNLTRFLYKNRSEVHKVEGTKEWKRTFDMKEITQGENVQSERKNNKNM